MSKLEKTAVRMMSTYLRDLAQKVRGDDVYEVRPIVLTDAALALEMLADERDAALTALATAEGRS